MHKKIVKYGWIIVKYEKYNSFNMQRNLLRTSYVYKNIFYVWLIMFWLVYVSVWWNVIFQSKKYVEKKLFEKLY